jgi:hypothetical protein
MTIATRPTAGVTMVELAVAVTISAIVISTTFYGWREINQHVIESQRKSILQVEARRIASSLASQLRRSPQVLEWHNSGISYISPTGKPDTVIIEWDGSNLLRNDKVVKLMPQASRIAELSFEGEELGDDARFGLLLHLRFRMENDFNDIASYDYDIAVTLPAEQTEPAKNNWNF